MPRRANGNRGNGKAVIVVFCEGESEQAYTEYLKKRFADDHGLRGILVHASL